MRSPRSYLSLEDFGRVRLSPYFYMRDFLYTEIGSFYGIPNVPENPDLAIEVGRKLCEHLLDPMTETFGRLAIRSAYRSPKLNDYGASQVKPQKCAMNEKNYAGHIWDRRDAKGRMGACTTVVIPWFADHYAKGRDWRDLAWWVHDHLDYHEMYFFPKLAAFNLTWREDPARRILSYATPKGTLLPAGAEPVEEAEARASRYADFPPFRGITYPKAVA